MLAFARLTRPLALGLRAHPRQAPRYRSTMGVPDEHIHPHATGAAAKTVEARQAPQELIFYSGWFCPFVQRSWIALEEKGVPYQYKEVNPYKKEKHFLDINPKGLVPALEYKGRPLNESIIISEFIEEAFPDHKPNLLPSDAFERARIRLWIDHISKKVIPNFFKTVQGQDEKTVKAGRDAFNQALKELADQVKGPFFLGEDFSLLDLAIAPWAVRDYIIQEHRGYERSQVGEKWTKYAQALESRDSVKKTSSERQYYEEIYDRYLKNEAQSEVAKATRGGQDLP